ncbi:MAG: type II toxin-antitoxin system Phd/YefM family antitoxin, partial [Candidatus Dormibacteraceae bacterium]
ALRMCYDPAMTTRIAQRELRNNNAEILNRVEAGESFVVTRNGVAVADVFPHSERSGPPMFPKTRDVMARQTTRRPALDREAWLRDIREADNDIDDDPLDSRG